MPRKHLIIALAATALIGSEISSAIAQDVVKIGMSFAMTGAGFNAAGRQAAAGARLYVQQHGNSVAGKKIELILRDDGGVADNARRLVQEMIVNDKVSIIAGGITPTALAYGQLVTQAKIATVVMISGASVTTTASPYYVRTSFILSQSSWIMGEWAAKNGSRRVVTLVNEWAPGTEAETSFKQRFTQLGGEIIEFDPNSACQSGLCPVPAARSRSQSRYRFHLFSGYPGRHFRQAVRRARSCQLRDQDHRPGRSYRRRRAQYHG